MILDSYPSKPTFLKWTNQKNQHVPLRLYAGRNCDYGFVAPSDGPFSIFGGIIGRIWPAERLRGLCEVDLPDPPCPHLVFRPANDKPTIDTDLH